MQFLLSLIKSYICCSVCKAFQSLIFGIFSSKRSNKVFFFYFFFFYFFIFFFFIEKRFQNKECQSCFEIKLPKSINIDEYITTVKLLN